MAYQWAPDYSSAIDRRLYPDAVWLPAGEGGGSEGGPGRPAGWYTGGINEATGSFMPTSQITGVTDTGSNDGSILNDYWSLKNAGLWNLQDPNSGTWKFLQAKSGGGDVLRDSNALVKGLSGAGLAGGAATSRDEAGRAQVEGALKEALNGVNPEFVSQFAPAVGQAVSDYWTTSKQSENQGVLKDVGDGARTFRDMFREVPPLMAAAMAITGGAAAGALGGGTGGAMGGGAIAGGGAAALKGGDFEDVLKGAGLGAVGGAVAGSMGGSSVGPGEVPGALGTASAGNIGGLSGGASPFMSGLDNSAIAGTDFNGAGTAAAGGTTGDGMWDWLDGLSDTSGFTTDPSLSGLEAGGEGLGVSGNMGWLDGIGDPQGGFTTNPSLSDLGGNINSVTGLPGDASFADYLKQYGGNASNALKAFLARGGGNASGGSTGNPTLDKALGIGGGGLGTGGSLLDTAFNASPFLLALNEANKQSRDLNGVLSQINGDAYSKSVLNPYDMDTGIGRQNMLQDQQLRGVRGSSFGDQSLTNYDYMRSLGRGDLFNRANLASAGLEGNLINQRNTNRNLLLGAGLNASGRMFSQQSDPFGLKNLLGG